MTKYILQSGNVKDYPERMKIYNEEVFRDFLSGGKNNFIEGGVKVLHCFFSLPRERWELKYQDYSNNLTSNIDLKLKTKMAMPGIFVEQCQWADAIIIIGGDDEILQYRMEKFDTPRVWKGKVVVGASAGANYLVDSFWTCDWRKAMDGKGVIPVKFIAHYKSYFGDKDHRGPIDWESAYEELKNYGDKNLPIHALEEGDFVVIKQ